MPPANLGEAHNSHLDARFSVFVTDSLDPNLGLMHVSSPGSPPFASQINNRSRGLLVASPVFDRQRQNVSSVSSQQAVSREQSSSSSSNRSVVSVRVASQQRSNFQTLGDRKEEETEEESTSNNTVNHVEARQEMETPNRALHPSPNSTLHQITPFPTNQHPLRTASNNASHTPFPQTLKNVYLNTNFADLNADDNDSTLRTNSFAYRARRASTTRPANYSADDADTTHQRILTPSAPPPLMQASTPSYNASVPPSPVFPPPEDAVSPLQTPIPINLRTPSSTGQRVKNVRSSTSSVIIAAPPPQLVEAEMPAKEDL
eukprot:GDKJ01000638.1.p1 GENE.GDKJ01000638.1~~GDKJ01000638.1.p1  ORF type:complete len:317 (+),score=102.86 GDKJ01000638.1:3-953(+)